MKTRLVPHGQLRALEVNGKPVIRLQIITYNAVDTFKWMWMPGCFSRTLANRFPQLAWSHMWSEVLGRAQSWEDDSTGPIVDFYLDDFDAVPRARQAYAQVKSGTIDDCSIGFDEPIVTRDPTPEERDRFPGVEVVCLEAELNEVSLVLRGAVPNAKVLAVRSAPGMVIDLQTAGQIATQLQAGVLTLKDALQAIEDAAVTEPEGDKTEGEEKPDVAPDEPVEVETPEGDEEEAPTEELAEEGPVGSPTEETQEDPTGEDESDEDDEDLEAKKAYDWEMELALKELDDQQSEKLAG